MEFFELVNLQKQATHYFELQVAGERPDFPGDIVRELLRTEEYDGWAVGLYLLSTLGAVQISQLYFGDQSTYRSISRFIATDMYDSRMLGKQELDHAYESDNEEFEFDWKLPRDLNGLVTLEQDKIQDIANLRNSATEASPDRQNGKMAIIIHGTWATRDAWWQPKTGQFWKHIKRSWPHLYDGPSPFWWSGANRDRSRLAAAQDLIRWTKLNGVESLDIIAHSHGGNVCLLAAQLGLQINQLVLLGTPIRTQYMLNLSNIGSIKNIFSIGDLVQKPGSLPHRRGEGRTLSDSSKVLNYRAMKNHRNRNPGHTELHDPATWKASNLDALL